MVDVPANMTVDQALDVLRQYFPKGLSVAQLNAGYTVADDNGVPISGYGSYVVQAATVILNSVILETPP